MKINEENISIIKDCVDLVRKMDKSIDSINSIIDKFNHSLNLNTISQDIKGLNNFINSFNSVLTKTKDLLDNLQMDLYELDSDELDLLSSKHFNFDIEPEDISEWINDPMVNEYDKKKIFNELKKIYGNE